ncbi:MAG TPA: thioredoxin-like domain-containing protein [Puia sp.]
MSPAKKIFLFSGLILLTAMLSAARAQGPAQAPVPLDSIQLKTVKGPLVSYGELTRKSPVILVCFWSVNSDASMNELNAINKQYDKWKQLASFKLIAVCVDQGNLLSRMRSTVNMNEWRGFDICADINGDLQQALKGNNLPQAVILKNGQVVYQQSGFDAGAEDYLFSKIQALSLPLHDHL